MLEHQTLALPENQTKTASAETMFYTALYSQGKKDGLSDKEAKQTAKDALIQFLWQDGRGTNQIIPPSQEMQDFSSFWNDFYNRHTMRSLIGPDVSRPQQNGVDFYIDAYRKRLGTHLDTSFFKDISGMKFFTDEKDGSTVSQDISSEGILRQQNKQLYRRNWVGMRYHYNVLTTYDEKGNLRTEIPYVKGHIHGMEKTYDKNGRLEIELPYVNGNPQIYDKEAGNTPSHPPKESEENGKTIHAQKETSPATQSDTAVSSLKQTLKATAQTTKSSPVDLKKLVARNVGR